VFSLINLTNEMPQPFWLSRKDTPACHRIGPHTNPEREISLLDLTGRGGILECCLGKLVPVPWLVTQQERHGEAWRLSVVVRNGQLALQDAKNMMGPWYDPLRKSFPQQDQRVLMRGTSSTLLVYRPQRCSGRENQGAHSQAIKSIQERCLFH
jgi:hypothetical protein